MNTIGHGFRVTIGGASHGAGIYVVVDGMPEGIAVSEEIFALELARRRGGVRGTTTRVEVDDVRLCAGVYRGYTTGAAIVLEIPNRTQRSEDYAALVDIPRPSHADFVSRVRYGGYADPRGGGVYSGRLTVGLVCAGVLARLAVPAYAMEAKLVEVGGLAEWEEALAQAMREGDSLGGVVECVVRGLPIGLGEPYFDSLESSLAHMLFSIPGVKGLEFGAGFAGARMRGSLYNDRIINAMGETATNHSGGINGGHTNGNPVVFRVAFRPTASIAQPQESYSFASGQVERFRIGGRHDVCFALRTPPVVEAATAVALADLLFSSTSSSLRECVELSKK